MDYTQYGDPDPGSYLNLDPSSPRAAAISIAIMIALAAIFLTVLKRSGFRAMVAVGRS